MTARARHLSMLAAALAVGCASTPPPTSTSPSAARAASPTSKPTTPAERPPDAILADAVQATGGAAAWNAHKTVRVKLTESFAGMGMSGDGEHVATSADKTLTTTTLPGVGAIREGGNGKVFWTQDPINGLRVLDGAEAEQARVEASWNPDLRAGDLFQKIETAADPAPGLECVVLTLKAGAPLRDCYDRRTHLQVSQQGIKATPQGDVPFKSAMKDWRSVGGVKIPFFVETQAGPITFQTSINDVTFDGPVDDRIFDPPAAGAAP